MNKQNINYIREQEQSDSIRESLSRHLFYNRENGLYHAPLEREVTFYEAVCSGNTERVKELFTPLGGEGFGKLCKNPLQNLKYHLVVTIAMITRFCISEGMLPDEGYNLSDIYIQKTDNCRNFEEINRLHFDLTMDYTNRMKKLINTRCCSQKVVKVLDYISEHLHERIYLSKLADMLSCSEPYLSQLFHSETGISLSTYITWKKVEAAAEMLVFSDMTSAEISEYFSFSSQSYFIKQFRRHFNMTPKEYRQQSRRGGSIKRFQKNN